MKYVTYYRVSTAEQGKSGLGLEAQQALVNAYLAAQPGEVVASHTEVESGKRSDRPELTEAIATARRKKATLLIAKLDRLARNVHFISGLLEQKVSFIAADCPNDDRFMLHIRAAIAEDEAHKISQRTKAALAAAKARGVRLGNPRIAEARQKITEARIEHARQVMPQIERIRSLGVVALPKIAEKLNELAVPTLNNGRWNHNSVKAVITRAA